MRIYTVKAKKCTCIVYILIYIYVFIPSIPSSQRTQYTLRRATRIFLGQRSLFGISGLRQTFTYSTKKKKKTPQGKNSRFFHLETLKIFILNDKFYLQMTTIRAFFLQIRALFSNFKKRAGETSTPSYLQLRT